MESGAASKAIFRSSRAAVSAPSLARLVQRLPAMKA